VLQAEGAEEDSLHRLIRRSELFCCRDRMVAAAEQFETRELHG
jgi:hypothetical protein